MVEHFSKQGYPLSIILKAREKAYSKSRQNLLNPTTKNQTSNDNLILVSTYQPEFRGLKNIIDENWDLLKKSTATKELSEEKIILGYRRPKNLRDLLVRARLNTTIAQTGTNKKTGKISNPCDNRKCRYCPLLDKTGRIKSTYTGRDYVTKYNVTCKSNNIIYCITCKKCRIQYVGQTK